MKKRNIYLILLVVGSLLLTSVTFYTYQVLFTPNILVDKSDKFITIPKGANFRYVQNLLYDSNYLQDAVSFSFLAKMMEYPENIKPGRYRLNANMSNRDAINLLRSGAQEPVDITFNNVRSREELAEKMVDNLALSANEFEEYINDPEIAEKYGFDSQTFLTMFIPNTYEVYWTITAEDLVERMYQEYQSFWTEKRQEKADNIGLTPVEVSILASIVEAETKKTEESQRIAGVYVNRLERGIPLQADPTLIFAVGDFSIRRVLNVHKEIDSPYNTYKYRGLPPGPINLPSLLSIDAVLNHEDHNYYYFCAKEDFSGYHRFATNLREHMKNARRYQQALNEARLYR